MDQKRIGRFLKELRKEKGLTQEQMAEKLSVSGRTVSRWETGSNMPDISLLTEIAGLLEVTIPEIINGERKRENMEEEVKEVAQRMADYAVSEKEALIKGVRDLSGIGVCGLLAGVLLEVAGLTAGGPGEAAALYCKSLVNVSVIMILLHSTGTLYRFRRGDRESSLPMPVRIALAAACAFAVAAVLRLALSALSG